jgi:hypothetical protein
MPTPLLFHSFRQTRPPSRILRGYQSPRPIAQNMRPTALHYQERLKGLAQLYQALRHSRAPIGKHRHSHRQTRAQEIESLSQRLKNRRVPSKAPRYSTRIDQSRLWSFDSLFQYSRKCSVRCRSRWLDFPCTNHCNRLRIIAKLVCKARRVKDTGLLQSKHQLRVHSLAVCESTLDGMRYQG